jgi:hypothetical protein
MRNLNTSTLFFVVAALLIGCAEQRPVQKVPDGNNDVLPKNLFTKTMSEGEIQAQSLLGNGNIWFSKVTVVKTSGNDGIFFAGYQSEMKAGQFRFTRDQLRFENANNINNGDSSVAGELISSWNIEHFETRLTEVDGRPTNREEEDNYRAWNKKRYFRINWADTDIAEASTFPYHQVSLSLEFLSCWRPKKSQVVEGSREITEDYVSFTIQRDYELNAVCANLRRGSRGDYTFTAHFKYSFMRAKTSDYQPMVYQGGEQDPLMKKYGYFQTVVENKGSVFAQEITILANRWHPNKKHTFYFAKDYPEQWKWIWNHPQRGVFAKTNALFKKHGLNNYNSAKNSCTTGLCFEIKENDGSKEFGDIRYSFIKLYDEPDPGAPFGYGPTDANPFTGEIIGANTILWTGYLKYMVHRLANDLELQTNDQVFQSSPLIQQMARTLKTEGALPANQYRQAWTYTAERMRNTPKVMDTYFDILPEFTYGYPGWSRFTARPLPSGHGVNQGEGPLRQIDSAALPTLLDPGVLGQVEEFSYAGALLESTEFEVAMSGLDNHLSFFHEGHNHQRNSTVYFGEDHFLDARNMLLAGRSKEDAVNSIMYRVSIHEFGHNLSLRHNFYGSVDKRNFREPFEQVITVNGEPQTIMREQTTSSVMEYQNIKQEYYLDESWESYDEAALVYAYSNRQIDLSVINNTRYLFCTDEHRVLNALCNVWDYGTAPSEIALNMVEDYDLMYYVMNERFDRPYWDTRGYSSRIAGRMYAMKKFLALYTTSMIPAELDREIRAQGKITGEDIELVKQRINMDVAQANNIVAAFYDGVVNYKRSEKDYLHEYDPWTGEITQIGIASDKIYAMFFLMGDSPLFYNPNRYRPYTSFVEFAQDSVLSPAIDRVLENTFTARIDMSPGFSGFGRILFALNAYNYANRDDTRLLDRIKVDCFKPETFEREIGLTTENKADYKCEDADELPEHLGWGMLCPSASRVSASSGYQDVAGTNEKIGMLKIDGNYYLMKELQNSYTFEFVERMINIDVNGLEPGPLESWKSFIRESYMLYWGVKEGRVPECK